MKKYLLAGIIIMVILIIVGASLVYLSSKKNQAALGKTTSETVAELFSAKYNRPVNTIVIALETDTGSFAKGTLNFTNELGGGGVWFAAKTAQGWEIAFDGNGIVTCEAANKYNFPTDIIPRCLDTLNQNELIVR